MYPPVYIPYRTPALICAEKHLIRAGAAVTADPEDSEYILYPIPTALTALTDYTPGKTIIGGNLDFLNVSVHRIDLLKDPYYLAINAAITAEAALGLIVSNLPGALTEAHILVMGWGRIGKCLTHQLMALNVTPTVYARNPVDQAMLSALGYDVVTPDELRSQLPDFDCIINTAPARILEDYDARLIRKDCFKIDLASVLSIPGEGVLHARGLPGKHKPEATGALIAATVLRHLQGGAAL